MVLGFLVWLWGGPLAVARSRFARAALRWWAVACWLFLLFASGLALLYGLSDSLLIVRCSGNCALSSFPSLVVLLAPGLLLAMPWRRYVLWNCSGFLQYEGKYNPQEGICPSSIARLYCVPWYMWYWLGWLRVGSSSRAVSASSFGLLATPTSAAVTLYSLFHRVAFWLAVGAG